MKHKQGSPVMKKVCLATLASAVSLTAPGFEGRIEAVHMRGDQTQHVVWNVGTNGLHITRTEPKDPETGNLVALDTGEILFIFPQNKRFIRYRPEQPDTAPAGFPGIPLPPGGLPPGIGPQSKAPETIASTETPGRIGPSGIPDLPEMPVNPGLHRPSLPSGIPPDMGQQSLPQPNPVNQFPMPVPPAGMERPAAPEFPHRGPEETAQTLRRGEVEFTATGETNRLLGFTCTRYEMRDRTHVMELWATDELVPFYLWQPDIQPRTFAGRRSVNENWADLLREKKLFPLLATLKNHQQKSIEQEFKVILITPENMTNNALFSAPADYREIRPPSF